MFQKQNGLAMNRENLAEIDVIEIKWFIWFCDGQGREKKGELKMRRTFPKLLRTHIEKMPVFRLSMIFMKTNELEHSLHDIGEKKGVSAPG